MRTEPINHHAISRHWRSPGPATTTARLAPLDQLAFQLHLEEPVRAPVERDFLGTVTGQAVAPWVTVADGSLCTWV